VTDDAGVRFVRFYGVAFRGDPDLGTDTVVPRFLDKTVSMPAGVKDTTLMRFLVATPDSVKETAFVFVEASDSFGNVVADSVAIVLGGPDVELLGLEENQTIQAGLNLSARVRAEDPVGIIQVQIEVGGAFQASVVKSINPASDSILLDTIILVPEDAIGPITVTAIARNNLDVTGQDGPITLNVVHRTWCIRSPHRSGWSFRTA
jgi:hypothetical protein